MSIAPGTRIGPYRIVARLGAGQMGQVFKAQDTRLERFVALKFLPLDLTRDPEAQRRFTREAKAASALDHSNICVIHDIGLTESGQLYLAMAYYGGGSLHDRIRRGPLTVDDALDIAIKLARGLEAAHAAGIVHRDLKPANVMFASDGEVKIVDFGLAKLAGESGLTRAGTVLGTLGYMAPEQVRGRPADHRSDIWALGVVLYEMLSGVRPFQATDVVQLGRTITGLAHLPLGSRRSGVPAELERIVDRTLEKRPDYRFQSAADLLSELRIVGRTSEVAGARGVRRLRLSLAALGLVTVAAVAAVLRAPSDRPPAVRFTDPVQITTAVGVEDYPAWSPDGQTLAYAATTTTALYQGAWDIWMAAVGGGPPVNRTADYPGEDRFPAWSPDGRQLGFWSNRDGGGYFVMSALGGAARRVAGPEPLESTSPSPIRFRDILAGGRPQWPPTGTELAVPVHTPTLGAALRIVSTVNGTERRVPLPGRRDGRRLDLSLSPDGGWLAYVDATGPSSQVTRLWIVRLEDGHGQPLSDGTTNERSPSWAPDSRRLYFVSNRGGSMDLWQQALADDGSPDGAPARLTVGMEIRQAVFSPDGSRVAYSRGRRIANLWRVPILSDRAATWTDAEQLTFDQALVEHVDVSPDGSRAVVSWDRRGNPDLWVLGVDGTSPRRLTSEATPEWAPAWSPDGRQIAYYSYRSGNRDLWILPAEGGPARQVTTHELTDWYPSWSPDGQSLVFWSERSGNSDLWTIAADGGEPRQITLSPAQDILPQWVPGGIIFASDREGDNQLWRIPTTGAPAERLTTGPGRLARMSAAGGEIYFLGWGERTGNIWAWSPDGTERPLTDFSGRPGGLSANALASTRTHVFFAWEEDLGDIWVMDVVED